MHIDVYTCILYYTLLCIQLLMSGYYSIYLARLFDSHLIIFTFIHIIY